MLFQQTTLSIKKLCFEIQARINEMTFISETNDRVKKQTLTKYVTTFEYADKTLFALSGASSGVSLALCATVIGWDNC